MLAALVNGVNVLDAQHAIGVEERGLAYGDGVFETMRLHDGSIRYLSDHIERLQRGCERLGIVAPAEAMLRREIGAVSASRDAGIVKLIVTRGATGRGYRAPDSTTPTRVLLLYAASSERGDKPITIRWCDARLSRNARLAGIKHLNRLEYVLAQNEWRDANIDEGLLLDTEGEVICATAGNVFVLVDGILRTPDLRYAGVRGVMRQHVLQAAKLMNLEVDENPLRADAVMTASELFITNAVRGIRPVCALGERRWEIGPITLQLLRATESTK